MNAHNKAQLTHEMINCALKGSNCDSPLSKMLKFTILASNASSSSTKLTQHHKGLFKACNRLSVKSICCGMNARDHNMGLGICAGATSALAPLGPAIEVSLNDV
uniref:Uncharacterized protein n=1 Tax=Solanum tuberosum TaxID=4113 RepID=M1DKN9_SOLTU